MSISVYIAKNECHPVPGKTWYAVRLSWNSRCLQCNMSMVDEQTFG